MKRESIAIFIPTHDSRIECGTINGMMQCADLFGGHAFIKGMSEINLARNLAVHAFLNLPDQFEWMIFIDSDIEFDRQDFIYLCEGSDHDIVCAEYARRPIDARAPTVKTPAQLALGFCRIHRSVFASLQHLKDDNGNQLVNAFYRQGEMLHDYFPTGGQGSGHWLSEDHGFFLLCKLAEIDIRVEKRTRLVHWGKVGAEYNPDQFEFPDIETDAQI